MRKVLIVCIGNTGNEAEAIRQTLEHFGCAVLVKYVGRPQDFIDVLRGELPFEADDIIISCHGEGGKILMPELGENVYMAEEPQGNFGVVEIEKYCRLKDKLIISTGCTTGDNRIARGFAKENCYIAPDDYVEGNSALMFVLSFFYALLQNEKSIEDAFQVAGAIDDETKLFKMI